jgi:MerR family mercuric resistance operon transcriptional regulator
MALTTGQLATAADVNIQTVRYYEGRGLVRAPRRTASGYRQYPDSVVQRIRFIKRARGLGFSLREIQELLALRVRPGSPADAVKRMTRLKIECVEGKIRRLQRITHALEQLAAACAARQSAHDFLFPQALED